MGGSQEPPIATFRKGKWKIGSAEESDEVTAEPPESLTIASETEESSATDQQGIAQNQNPPEVRADESSGLTDPAEAEETNG